MKLLVIFLSNFEDIVTSLQHIPNEKEFRDVWVGEIPHGIWDMPIGCQRFS